ncbi:MAG: polysaccharide biosynthesis protein [Brevinematia bacterium]
MYINEEILENKVIFITGSTGTVGKGVLKYLFKNFNSHFKEVRILSRDEYKLYKLMEEFSNNSKIVPRLGDIRDKDIIKKYLCGVDIVIHSAALKRVEFGEYYPYELIKTNIEGTKNIIDACIENNVSKALLISTDKAVEPTSTYGATKLLAERLFISANVEERNNFKTLFSVARLGNILNSRGSLVEVIREREKENLPLILMDQEMTRFWMNIEDVSKFIIFCIATMQGGEIFVPKLKSSRIIDLMKVLYPKAKIELSSPRPGEKIHEMLVSEYEKRICFNKGEVFVIYPDIINNKRDYSKTYLSNWQKIDLGLSFSSKDFIVKKDDIRKEFKI